MLLVKVCDQAVGLLIGECCNVRVGTFERTIEAGKRDQPIVCC
jgi:hypothetical protein